MAVRPGADGPRRLAAAPGAGAYRRRYTHTVTDPGEGAVASRPPSAPAAIGPAAIGPERAGQGGPVG